MKKILATLAATALCCLSGCGEEIRRGGSEPQQTNAGNALSSAQPATAQTSATSVQDYTQPTNVQTNAAAAQDTTQLANVQTYTEIAQNAIQTTYVQTNAGNTQKNTQLANGQANFQIMPDGEALEIMDPLDAPIITGMGSDDMEKALKAYFVAKCSPAEHWNDFFDMVPGGYIRYLSKKYRMTEEQIRAAVANECAESDYSKIIEHFQVTERTDITESSRYGEYLEKRGISGSDSYYRLTVTFNTIGEDYKESHDTVYRAGGRWYPLEVLKLIEGAVKE